jgi:hypothetical protein
MRDPITLLETIGADATLMSAGAAELGESLESSGVAPELLSALLTGDIQTLRGLLRAPDIVCCLIDPAEEEDDEEEEDEDEGQEDEDENDPTRKPKPRGTSR